MNGFKQEGFGLMDTTIFEGKRQSTSVTYLNPAKNRENLTIITNCFVKNIIIENNFARGIECVYRNKNYKFIATDETL